MELNKEYFQLGNIILLLFHVLVEVIDGGILLRLILGQGVRNTEHARAAAQAISQFVKQLLCEVNVTRFGMRNCEVHML